MEQIWQELIQHPDLTPHTTIFPDTDSTDKRYFQTNATHWDLRRAKRYMCVHTLYRRLLMKVLMIRR